MRRQAPILPGIYAKRQFRKNLPLLVRAFIHPGVVKMGLRRHRRLFDRNVQILHRRRHPVTRVQLIDKFGAYCSRQVGLIMGQFQNPVHDARGGSCAAYNAQSRLDGPLFPQCASCRDCALEANSTQDARHSIATASAVRMRPGRLSKSC